MYRLYYHRPQRAERGEMMETLDEYLFELTFEDGTTERLQCEKIGSEWRFDEFTISEAYIDIVIEELKKKLK